MDPWQAMDDWCKKRAARAAFNFETHIINRGLPLDDPEARKLYGQSIAYNQMRSFIHRARDR